MRDEQAWAELLLSSLQAFSEQQSNPVLTLLGAERRLVAERKYPDPPLAFGDDAWRAYYHFHTTQQANEHGHFHIFTRAAGTEPGWGHVAALGMDGLGQPLRWFAVNAWVTRDAWLPATVMADALGRLATSGQAGPLPAWLAAMLGLYAESLNELWQCRDEAIDQASAGRPRDVVLQDRAVYELAAIPIDLQSRLESVLL